MLHVCSICKHWPTIIYATVFLVYHIYVTLSCINVLGLVMGTVKESEQGLSLVTTDTSNDIPNMVTAAPLKTSTISQ